MSESRERGIEPDELIGKLVPDPENPGVRRVVGFGLGVSDRPGYWRLYVNPDLTEFLEFRKDDCLHAKESRDRTVAWLKPDAKIARTWTDEATLQSIRGDIRNEFLRPTGFAALARATGGGGQGGLGTCATRENCCLFTIVRPL
jgi:hypothetical protein